MNNHPNQTRLGIWIGSTLLPRRRSETDHWEAKRKKKRRNRDGEKGGVREVRRERGGKTQTRRRETSRFRSERVSRWAIEGKKEERTAEGEQSSLTVDVVLKEGGQTASHGLQGDASSWRSSERRSALHICCLAGTEMRSSEICSPTNQWKGFK